MSPLTLRKAQGKVSGQSRWASRAQKLQAFVSSHPGSKGSLRREGSRADVGQEPTDSDGRETKKGEGEKNSEGGDVEEDRRRRME